MNEKEQELTEQNPNDRNNPIESKTLPNFYKPINEKR